MKLPFAHILQVSTFSILLSACASQQPAFTEYVPGLGEIMAQTATRHLKLWYAGLAQNWPLAAYEIEELKEGFEDAGKFHPTHKDIKQALPVLLTSYMEHPLEQLEQAIKERNPDTFRKSYDTLTAGCNTCHQATGFGFNQVKRPDFNPFTNQVFEIKTQN